MPDYTEDDLNQAQGKPPKGRKIPYPPGRDATFPEIREWASNAAGLSVNVRIEAVPRQGREPEDPLTIVLSNGMRLRCPHQSRLQQPRTLQAFLTSESDGIAQPPYLSPAEVGDFYTQLCRLSTVAARSDPVADLHERLLMFVDRTEEMFGEMKNYEVLMELRARPLFDRNAAQGMKSERQPEFRPVLLNDNGKRYVRASEWVTYLRFVHGWTVNESQLVGRMAELGSERSDPQMWNEDRSHKVHLVFYSVPEES
jgi:hypothetical protein